MSRRSPQPAERESPPSASPSTAQTAAHPALSPRAGKKRPESAASASSKKSKAKKPTTKPQGHRSPASPPPSPAASEAPAQPAIAVKAPDATVVRAAAPAPLPPADFSAYAVSLPAPSFLASGPASAAPAPKLKPEKLRAVVRRHTYLWRAYQSEADLGFKRHGLLLLLWRRQAGKTEMLSTWAIEALFKEPGTTVILASASLNVGGEVALRAAHTFATILACFRSVIAELERMDTGTAAPDRFIVHLDDSSAEPGTQNSHLATPSAAQLKTRNPELGTANSAAHGAALAAAFTAGKLAVHFKHDCGRFSRLKVLAPNPATARGFSGTVFLDEIGFIPNFREVWDAVEPITASDPNFRLIMCTTPPADTAHYAHELIVPPAGLAFTPANPDGTWYRSEAGIMVHRVDAWDADAAGARLFHPETRVPLSVDEHRALALDKEAWDRNYGLRLATTGTAAVSLSALHHAQNRAESARCLAFENQLPPDWRIRLGDLREPVTLGFDVATTERESSNPSALAVIERTDTGHAVRLLFRWKTDDPKVSTAYLREFVSTLRVRRLCVDATNEKFFAQSLRDELSRHCPVELVVSSEKIAVGAESHLLKTYLGNLVVSALDDARLALPPDRWVNLDFRLVRKSRGGFDAEVDGSGHHADTFDATKLALHGWLTPATGAFTAETLAQVRLSPAVAATPLLSRPSLTPASFSFS